MQTINEISSKNLTQQKSTSDIIMYLWKEDMILCKLDEKDLDTEDTCGYCI